MLNTPYYNLHQIETGLYTRGGEYVVSTGEDYVGEYHALPNGQLFTESQPKDKSFQIFKKRIKDPLTKDVINYNKYKKSKYWEYNKYAPKYNLPTDDDYNEGKMERFFIQQRTKPTLIVEIDGEQYNDMNFKQKAGINSNFWNSVKIMWYISKLPIDSIQRLNGYEISRVITNFPYLQFHLRDLTQFYKTKEN